MSGAEHLSHEPAEAWCAPIEAHFADAGARIVKDFLADAARLLDPDGLLKALPGPERLDYRQIEDLKLLIRQHYTCHMHSDYKGAFWRIPQEALHRWRASGVIGPTGAWSLSQPLDDALLAARLAGILDSGTSYARMVEMARERPRSRVEELSRELALGRTLFALDGMAMRHADNIARIAIGERQREVNRLVADFVGGVLVAEGRPVTSNRALAGLLRRRLRAGDIERDWQRVVATEVRFAVNHGSLAHYQEQGIRRVYYRVHPDACKDCRRLLLHPDGTPRVFPLDQILAEIAAHGGTNIGRPASEWVATLVVHPFCRCQIMPYVERMPMFSPQWGRR